jgi:hypothetical protein
MSKSDVKIVYLDSSDISNFAQAQVNSDEKLINELNRMLSLQDDNIIDMRYSCVHLV